MTTRYAAVGIVRDEAETIGRCLASLAGVIDQAIFLDTGSTDGTPDVIRAAFPEARVTSAAFVDFGHARSQVFAEAARWVVGPSWLIATDADMTWEIDPEWEPDPDVDAYLILMRHMGLEYRLPLLLNAKRQWISNGPVHEYTTLVSGELGRRELTDAVRVTHHGEGRGGPGKLQWHASLLRTALERDPSDVRSTYYLAQTMRDLGLTEDARRLYVRRAAMGGWEEERWHAQYQAALLTQPRQDRLTALLAAWEARPARHEPLYHAIEELKAAGLHRAALALLEAYNAIWRVPSGDILFVEANLPYPGYLANPFLVAAA